MDRKYMTLDDKYYFAAYINMARHNVYLLLADISTRMGEKVPNDDAKLIFPILQKLEPKTTTGKNSVSPDEQLKIIKELHKHFPFLKTMLYAYKKPMGAATEEEIQKMDYAPGDYYDLFTLFFKVLNDYRNEFTHTISQPNVKILGTEEFRVSYVFDFPANLLYGLRVTFDTAVRKAKTRFNFTPDDTKHLLRQGKGGKELVGFKYKFQAEGSKSLTIHGLTFFICLLLERKYATLFTQKLQGLKDKRSRGFKATYEVFAVHCIRLPNARYTSDTSNGALLLDMLNELKKCPTLLFPQLPAKGEQNKDQDAFRIKVEDMPGMEEEGDSGFVLLKRHEDRFSYLALRFMDEVKWFNLLHFPVDLGNYHYHLYDKIVDGLPRIGSLWEKMIGYGRLPDYQHKFLNKDYPAEWQLLWQNHELKKENENDKSSYMPPTMPHYHFPDGKADNIAIKITNPETLFWPAIHIDGNDKKAGKPAKKEHPDLLLSKYELFAFIFYGLLIGKDRIKKELEDKLVQYFNKRKQLYRNIINGKLLPLALPADIPKPKDKGKKPTGYDQRKELLNQKLAIYGCTADELPDEIKCFLMGVITESFEIKARYRLEDLIVDTEILQERIKRQLKEKRKPGSKKDVEIKAGVLAGFLAKDIMLFQPADKTEGVKASGKPTSTLYNVLQAKLALYGANVDTLERTFNECGLLSGSTKHPFLGQVVSRKPATIVDFYMAYLTARHSYLLKCETDKNYQAYQWLKNNQARKKTEPHFGQRLAAEMEKLPVVIPRGFFAESIKNELLALNNDKLNAAIVSARTPNTSFMFMAYLKEYLDDDVQDFYGWPRVYKIFDNFHDKRTKSEMRKSLKPEPLSEEARKGQMDELKKWIKETPNDEDYGKFKKRYDDFESNEKQIRQLKVQDITTFAMCDYLLKNINRNLINSDGQFYLKDIAPKGDKGILDKPMSDFGRVFDYCCTSKDFAGVEITIEGKTRIFQDDLKVKNIGDFNKFIKDRRLPNLLAYLQKEQIHRAELEKELERYDIVRIEIFKIIHEFEKAILTKYPGIDGKDFDNIISHFQQSNNLPELTAMQIKKIRNAFSHNQYPDPIYFLNNEDLKLIGTTGVELYTDYFFNFIKTILVSEN